MAIWIECPKGVNNMAPQNAETDPVLTALLSAYRARGLGRDLRVQLADAVNARIAELWLAVNGAERATSSSGTAEEDMGWR